ncbi:SNO glutamine amidotransferase [Pyrolobus fumarii 1A]|uniref:Pyridoxal 5'-phosphate synthase subunit PdxT n=1 Tax=Pyrolobus fumarii (strain DSM 11204 / 1A) TaxID=694429 RepID=G0EDN8_PYRF1|nr:pyridoxal 5'-phosphate synthase glutaminase subunit PdxT [Pyrolobus fumarii]AEM37875.1 SNO glutamine amidotransferase [Pyrolobus fumarii 1A]
MKIGVVGLQGGVYEHVYMFRRVFAEEGISGEVVVVKKPGDLQGVDGVVLPGGESTTIQRLAKKVGLWDALRDTVESGTPVMGTCAGAILLAKRVVDAKVGAARVETLSVLDVTLVRNAYGRQRESFEIDIEVPWGDKPFRAVFIRAPAIVEVGPGVEVLATLSTERVPLIVPDAPPEVPVIVRQGGMLATTFHPELSGDTRIHRYFVDIVRGRA